MFNREFAQPPSRKSAGLYDVRGGSSFDTDDYRKLGVMKWPYREQQCQMNRLSEESDSVQLNASIEPPTLLAAIETSPAASPVSWRWFDPSLECEI